MSPYGNANYHGPDAHSMNFTTISNDRQTQLANPFNSTHNIAFSNDNNILEVSQVNNVTFPSRGLQNQTINMPPRPHLTSLIPVMRRKVDEVKSLINLKAVLLVCGAPLVGKSTIVNQAINERNQALNERKSNHVMCKGLCTFDGILRKLSTDLHLHSDCNRFNAAEMIWANIGCGFETFVFHKCEDLREIDRMDFLNFLFTLNTLSKGYIRSVVTSYKQFAIPYCLSVYQIQIGMMDSVDIHNFLHFYVGSNLPNIGEYIQMIIRNNLCFPLGVRHLIEVHLLQGGQLTHYFSNPDVIERNFKKCLLKFLSTILSDRVMEVDSWVDLSKRKWIALFCFSHDATSTEDLLSQMTSEEYDDNDKTKEYDDNDKTKLADLLKIFAVTQMPGMNHWQFHPLVVYYFLMLENDKKIALEGMWFDINCAKVVRFLCNILCMTDEMSHCAGHKSAIFQCVLPEWPNIKNIIQMAIHCNHHTYRDFCKIALVGANLLIKWFPRESVQFFKALYDYAYKVEGHEKKSFRRQAAILEGLMGSAMYSASHNSQKGK